MPASWARDAEEVLPPVRPFAAWSLPSESSGSAPETAILDVASGDWIVLEAALSPGPPDGNVTWAGPSALARSASGSLEIVPLDGAGARRVLFGTEPEPGR